MPRGHCGSLEVSLIRYVPAAVCVANAANPVVTAFPTAQRPSQISFILAKVEFASMLPDFRFLFAAIVLSTSILIFGLGAAALLRAAHEEFASAPPWHAAPGTIFAQQDEAAKPVLAMLRVEPPAAEQRAPAVDQQPADIIPPLAAPAEPAVTVSAPAEPVAVASTAAEPEMTAALKSEDLSPETANPEITIPETPAPGEAAEPRADAPGSADRTKIAATNEASPPVTDAAPTASEPVNTEASPDADLAATKIATLGSSPVTADAQPPAKAATAKPDKDAEKRIQARRAAARRRRIALRERAMQQAAQQQPAGFFAPQPLGAVGSH
jgi:hypothetical protein